MAPSPLTREDICAILEAGRRSGVSSLRYGDFSVEFQRAATGETFVPAFVDRPEGGETPLTDVPEQDPSKARVELSPEEKQVLEDAHLGQLMTDDPLAYEQAVIDSTIGDGANAEGENAR